MVVPLPIRYVVIFMLIPLVAPQSHVGNMLRQ